MKKSGASIVTLLQAVALAAVFAFVATGAYAHTPGNSGRNAAHVHTPGNSVWSLPHNAVFDKHPHELDCTSFASGGLSLHCHLTSVNAEATGPVRLVDDDQLALFVPETAPMVRDTETRSVLAVTHVPITGPPAYILFGNFRS